MPYHVGAKGSYGCSGYPALKDDGTVMGCHTTAEEAASQIYAINQSEGNIEAGVGIKNPEEWPIGKALPDAYGPASADGVPTGRNCANCMFYDTSKVLNGKAYCTKWDDYVRADYYCKAWEASAEMDKAQTDKGGTSMGTKAEKPNYAEIIDEREGGSDPSNKELYARIIAEAKSKFDVYPSAVANAWVSQEYKKRGGTYKSDDLDKKAPCWDGYTQRGMKPGDNGRMVPNCIPVSKAESRITEGDFVSARTTEGMIVGQVEHIMIEGGTYGEPGNPYAVESTPENPAVAIRILEEDDEVYYYTPYSIGALMSDVERINMPNISMEDYEDDEYMDKAEGYSPPAGARAAARRAIKFKEDGKATGAGTAVGWTRARQLANGETLSLSTVKRMYSYFSRHEVDKKGKDWGNQANPSNGYIMWLAWGGDAGYSWSRRIAQRETDKVLFSDFGKDYTKSVKIS